MLLQDDDGKKFCVTQKKLGRGTFADVYLGKWLNCPNAENCLVAVKEFNLSKQTLQRILSTEISIMKKLDHPNIVKLIAVITKTDEDNNHQCGLWVILEYCEGGDFKSFLKDKRDSPNQRRLNEKYACAYMKQIAEGLQYLRTQNIVHRDLKPHNLLLTKDKKVVKIADFGFARILGSEALEATVCGSPLYMAPEVLRGDQYNSKADLWSVGIILYEIICGQRPFQDVKDIITLKQRLERDSIQFPSRVVISRECRKLLCQLLQKNPDHRIEWDDFFNNDWFNKTDWSTSSVIKPITSQPVPIPQQQKVKFNIIPNYMDQLSSAPARVEAAFSPQSCNAFSPGSIFIPATTPYTGSEPPRLQRSDSFSENEESETSTSYLRASASIVSDVFGFLKDSFHTGH